MLVLLLTFAQIYSIILVGRLNLSSSIFIIVSKRIIFLKIFFLKIFQYVINKSTPSFHPKKKK